MNLCKDCKHKGIDATPYAPYPPKCQHPNAPIDPVYGGKTASCDLMRSPNCLITKCGADGDWFEQAPPAPAPAPAPVSLPEINETWSPPPHRGFFKKIFG